MTESEQKTDLARASKWRVSLYFLMSTIVVGSVHRRISETFPLLETVSGLAGVFLAALLTAALIARRGEWISSGAAAVAVSVPIVFLAVAFATVYNTDPAVSVYLLALSYGGAIVLYGIPSYWLLVKLPATWLTSRRSRKQALSPMELYRGFWTFPLIMLGVCSLIFLVLAGVLFWFGEI